MGRRRSNNWWSLGAVTVITVIVLWGLYRVWRSPQRDDLATYGAFALAVLVIVGGWLTRAWRKGKSGQPDAAADAADLDRVADQLAPAVQAQWEKAARARGLTDVDPIRVTWGRPSLPMAGPLAAATASQRFAPIPGLAPAGQAELAGGDIAGLHAVYGGLRSGRLIITGPPGSGKTGAAILLILAALQYRAKAAAQDRQQIPVPVLVTAQDWNPELQPVTGWLTGKLQDSYPQFTSPEGVATAAALIGSGKIAVIVDGLDEITPEMRPVAVRALSQQAAFRIVVLSRTTEMATTASQQGVLHGAAAVELHPVDSAEAAHYLERVQLDPAPAGWQELIERIKSDPDGPLGATLDNPLTLTLVRDTYQAQDDVRELLEFSDTALSGMSIDLAVEEVTGHLLDRILPAAYSRQPGQPRPRYDLETAQRTLVKIAAQMNKRETRDLNWWLIPGWMPRMPRVIMSGLVAGLLAGLATGLSFGLTLGPVAGPVAGLLVGLLVGLSAAFGEADSGRPKAIGDFHLRKAFTRTNLFFAVFGGIGGGLVSWVVSRLEFERADDYAVGFTERLLIALLVGLVVTIVVGLEVGLMDVITADVDSGSFLSPASSLAGDWYRNLVVGLVVGCVVGIAAGVWIGLVHGVVAGVLLGFFSGVATGLAVSITESMAWSATLASVQIAMSWRSPARLTSFLGDAYDRNILRAVGSTYQFRHARLQDRLAALPEAD
jgi:hypothetical protein